MDTILVTGGSGFIGTHVCKTLVEAGHRVVNLDLFPRREAMTWLIGEAGQEVVFEEGSAADYDKLLSIVRRHGVRKIAHVAAMINNAKSLTDPRAEFSAIAETTLNVLEVCKTADIDRLVYFSSIGVLPAVQYQPIDANHPVLLATGGPAAGGYGAGKVGSEALCWTYRDTFGLDFVILRPSAAYGFLSANLIYLSQFLEAALRGEPCHFDQGADYPRDYTHVHDIAGITQAALAVSADRLTDRVFYAASGMDPLVTAGETAQIVREMIPSADVGIGPGLNFLDSLEIRMRGVLDVRNVEEQLGYQIKFRDVRQGMKEHADRYSEWLMHQGKTPAKRKF